MSEIKQEPSDERQEENTNKIVFKKKPKKNLRSRRVSEDEDDPELSLAQLEEIKEKQKLRQRPKGVSLIGLALGKKLAPEEEVVIDNPLHIIKTGGGLVNMTTLKAGKVKEPDDAYDTGIGTQFSAETNKRDEDEEMMKYIDQELEKRKGVVKDNNSEDASEANKYLLPEEAALFAVPEHLRKSTSQRSEEMLSNQMLNGIPEVDLGIHAKIKNIEATEEAKQKLLQDQKNKKDGPSQFVPANMAVNFMQHNRFSVGDTADQLSKRQNRSENTQNGQSTQQNPGAKRATDDYHYDKFKKQFRRF